MIKRAVALGGGGARGAYHIGVWQGLRELGKDYSIVTGTSIGALNAGLMAQGDFDRALELWEKLETEQVVAVRPGREALERLEGSRVLEFVGDMARFGGTDTALLEKILNDVIDEDRLRQSRIQFGLVATSFPALHKIQLTLDQIPHGKLTDYMLASACYYPVFRQKDIDGAGHIDGAYTDNLPAALALQCGADEIIAVDLGSSGVVPRLKTDVPVTLITSAWSLGPTLYFSPRAAKRNMALGRLDTLRAYGRAEGALYAFYPGETRRNTMRMLRAVRAASRISGIDFLAGFDYMPRFSNSTRQRSRRLLGRREEAERTLGMKITTAAETAGELLGIPPDRMYTFEAFNTALEKNASFLREESASIEDTGRRLYRARMWSVYRMLAHAVHEGRLPDFFWERVIPFPRAYFAALYLLMLEM